MTLALTGPAMAQTRIVISSDWGKVTAELVDNEATRALVAMLPVTIAMRDHMHQGEDRRSPFAAARSGAADAFCEGDVGAVERGPFRHLLSRWPRPAAGDHHPWASV